MIGFLTALSFLGGMGWFFYNIFAEWSGNDNWYLWPLVIAVGGPIVLSLFNHGQAQGAIRGIGATCILLAIPCFVFVEFGPAGIVAAILVLPFLVKVFRNPGKPQEKPSGENVKHPLGPTPSAATAQARWFWEKP